MPLKERIQLLLSIRESPRKLAISFSIGVSIGLSPLLGLHTLMGIGAAYLLRLNWLATLSGVYVTNPWTALPIYTFSTWVGLLLTRRQLSEALQLGDLSLPGLLSTMGYLVVPFVVGSTAVSIAAGLALYPLLYRLLRGLRR